MYQEQIFDRDKDVAKITNFLCDPKQRLLVVVGECGCGKSRLVDKALAAAENGGVMPADAVLGYRFGSPDLHDESAAFPDFLGGQFSRLRPSHFIERFFHRHGIEPESWSLQSPFFAFNFRPPDLSQPTKARLFFAKLASVLGSRFRLLRLENGENYGALENLEILGALAREPQGPKLLVEIGTLVREANLARRFLSQECQAVVLEVDLFSREETQRFFRFTHPDTPAPPSLFDTSRGNALAIRHHGTALADLPVAGPLRRKLGEVDTDEMRIIWPLAALRGEADSELLREVSGLGSEFDKSLIALSASEIVTPADGARVRFAHSLFLRYFLSKEFGREICLWGREPIISLIRQRGAGLIADQCELAMQYDASGDHESAFTHALRAASSLYHQQDFRGVMRLSETLDNNQGIAPNLFSQGQRLLIQTGIRMGDADEVVRRLVYGPDNQEGVDRLLWAQAYYLTNRFELAVRSCELDPTDRDFQFLLPRALGIRAACLIAQNRHGEAADDFAAASSEAERVRDRELGLELLRLAPELDSSEVWRLRFEEVKRSRLPDEYPYLYAKCLHNFAAELLLDSGGNEGLDELRAAAKVFEEGRYPEYSYAAVMTSASALLRGRYDEACSLLEDGLLWCHERYDTFSVLTNLGVAAALAGDWPSALERFVAARKELEQEPFPLSDPHFIFQAYHNLAVAHACLGEWELADRMLAAATVPRATHDREFLEARRAGLLEFARQHVRPPPPWSTRIGAGKRWNHREQSLEIATLQFFDFNVNVLPPHSLAKF